MLTSIENKFSSLKKLKGYQKQLEKMSGRNALCENRTTKLLPPRWAAHYFWNSTQSSLWLSTLDIKCRRARAKMFWKLWTIEPIWIEKKANLKMLVEVNQYSHASKRPDFKSSSTWALQKKRDAAQVVERKRAISYSQIHKVSGRTRFQLHTHTPRGSPLQNSSSRL